MEHSDRAQSRADLNTQRQLPLGHLTGVGDGSISSETFQKIFEEMDKDTVKEVPSAPEYDHRLLVLLQAACRHRYFDSVGNVFALANVLCITVELAIDARKAPDKRDDYFLGVMNCSFIAYYLLEQLLKLLALGWRSFITSTSNAMDGAFTLCLVVVEIVCVSVYGFPHPGWNPEVRGSLSLWEIVRIVNLLIVLRLVRIIPHIKGMALVAGTLLDLIRNLRSFAGILLVVYYAFAIVGMELFRGSIIYVDNNGTGVRNASACGSYEQLQYWSSNFDDFAASLVLLWDVMVVNNWQVFLDVFSRYAGP
ncbi:two pore channel protein 2-like [Lampetra fluviatilis]